MRSVISASVCRRSRARTSATVVFLRFVTAQPRFRNVFCHKDIGRCLTGIAAPGRGSTTQQKHPAWLPVPVLSVVRGHSPPTLRYCACQFFPLHSRQISPSSALRSGIARWSSGSSWPAPRAASAVDGRPVVRPYSSESWSLTVRGGVDGLLGRCLAVLDASVELSIPLGGNTTDTTSAY